MPFLLRRAAPTLKASRAMFGAIALAQLCEELETIASLEDDEATTKATFLAASAEKV